MVAVPSQPPGSAPSEESVVIRATWPMYLLLRDSLDEQGSNVRLTYLEGTLEIMSPGNAHEETKKLLARLLEAWIQAHDLLIDGTASTTFRSEAHARGLEADESYSKGKKPVPDLAIEVVVTPPKVDKLEVYRGLGVPEVWVFRNGKLTVNVLREAGYVPTAKSLLFPTLDVPLLASFVRLGEPQTALVKAFLAASAKPKKRRT